jgi:hypothetical protein
MEGVGIFILPSRFQSFEVSQPGLRAANFQVLLHSYFFLSSFSPVACFFDNII